MLTFLKNLFKSPKPQSVHETMQRDAYEEFPDEYEELPPPKKTLRQRFIDAVGIQGPMGVDGPPGAPGPMGIQGEPGMTKPEMEKFIDDYMATRFPEQPRNP